MTSLRTVQVWGVITKVLTVALGVLQTAVVLRILSPAQYGIIGIVVSLGSLVGVSQHVGVVDATIREIAVSTEPRRRAHVFWVSLWFRLLVTVPISVVLAFLAPWIGRRVYPYPDVSLLIVLTSVILILQGIQGVVGGAYTGRRAFGRLYALQVVMAVVNVPLFGFMTWWYGVRGFFEAVILSTAIFISLLVVFLHEAIGGRLVHPRRHEVRGVLRDIVHTGSWTYVARILSVAWQRVPILILGWWVSVDVVGLFAVALTFGSKLVILASALGEVNLAFLSTAFAHKREEFQRLARSTLDDVGAALLLAAGFLGLFADVLLRLVAGTPYSAATGVTILVTWGYALFAFLDIGTNSLFVPARRSELRALGFGALFITTGVVLWALRGQPLLGAAVSVLAGAIAGILTGEVAARARMGLTFFSRTLVFLLIPGGLLAIASAFALPLIIRGLLSALCGGVMVWAAFPSLRRIVAPRAHASTAGG